MSKKEVMKAFEHVIQNTKGIGKERGKRLRDNFMRRLDKVGE